MADALSYSAEPVKPQQDAMDAARAYKAAKQAKEAEIAQGAAASNVPEAAMQVTHSERPSKGKISFEIVSAEPSMAERLLRTSH